MNRFAAPMVIAMALTFIKCSDRPIRNGKQSMELSATSSLGIVDYELISADASVAIVEEQIDSMSWSELSAVKLVASERLFIEGSGSHQDGFSIIYGEDQEQFITKEAPPLDVMRECILRFAASDESWRSTVEWEYFQKWD